jgi:DNA-binding LacI/PurR family transcriptional regulator
MEAHKLIASFSKKPKKVAAFVKKEEHISTILMRIEGIKEACEKDAIAYEIFHLPADEQAVDRLVTQELMKGTDSFLPLNNIAAFQLVASFRRLLLNVPGEVRLISFDDHPAFEYFYPPVSALRQPIKTMAEESVTRLVHRLDEKQNPGKHLLLSCTFVPRGTH